MQFHRRECGTISKRCCFGPFPINPTIIKWGISSRASREVKSPTIPSASTAPILRVTCTWLPSQPLIPGYDKEVYNGDIGYVEAIDLELGEMTIAFDGRPVAYMFGELDQIVLAYATTIHKSQGSEFPAIVIPITTQHYMMLQRNLLYTGVTRGKRLVILLGQKKAVAIAVKNVSGRRRWSKLREWLNPI